MNAPAALNLKPSFGDAERQLVTEADTTLAVVQEYVVDGPEMYALAGQELVTIKERRHLVEQKCEELADPFKKIKAEAESGRKKIYDFFEPAVNKLKQAENVLTRVLVAYRTEQERKRQEAEAAARAEQQRLQREADEKRRKAEAEAAELQRKAEEAAAAGRAAEAAKLAAKAETKLDKAEQIQAPIAAPPVNLPPAPGKIAGMSFRRTWKGRVLDKAKLVAHIAQNPQYLHLLDVNESALNKLAGALQKNMALALPGSEAFEAVQSARNSK